MNFTAALQVTAADEVSERSKASASAVKPATRAAAKSNASHADIEFLEYLGTMESDEDNWTDVASADSSTKPVTTAAKLPATNTKVNAPTKATKESGK